MSKSAQLTWLWAYIDANAYNLTKYVNSCVHINPLRCKIFIFLFFFFFYESLFQEHTGPIFCDGTNQYARSCMGAQKCM